MYDITQINLRPTSQTDRQTDRQTRLTDSSVSLSFTVLDAISLVDA